MELHEKFLYPNMRDAIFGLDPEYSDKFDLAIYLRKIIILASAFARVYFKAKRDPNEENMTSRTIERIVERPFISIDNAVSILVTIQNASEDMDQLGLSDIKIVSDETSPDFINIYEIKAVLQDETGKFFNTVGCMNMLNKAIACMSFITATEICNEGERVKFKFKEETFDISDLFKYEFCYLYRSLQDVDPIETGFFPL